MTKRLSRILPLLLLLTLFSVASEARADPITITFDDVSVPGAGIQQITNDRYTPLGVYLQGSHRGEPPFVVSGGDGAPSNFLFGGTSPDDPFQNDLHVGFVLPGTNIIGATNFVSFDVIATGDTQNGLWQVFVSNSSGAFIRAGEGFGFGNGTFSFSMPGYDIAHIWITYPNINRDNNNQFFTGRIGIDNLRFNSPTTPAPEPATLLLLGTGIAGIGMKIFRRRKGRTQD